jgi:putative nucleotidyltransferase with HDIG domain
MKEWISKSRAQRLRERMKDGGRKGVEDKGPWWNQPVIGLAIGFLLWLASATLFLAHKEAPLKEARLMPADITGILMLLIMTVVAMSFLKVSALEITRDNAKLLLMAMCAILPPLAHHALVQAAHHWRSLPLPAAELLTPFAIAPLMVGAMVGGRAAVITGAWTAFACYVLSHFNLAFLASNLIATAAAAQLAKGLRRRTQLIKAGFIIGFLQIVCLGTMSDRLPADPVELGKLALACLASGIGAALLALLALPVAEPLFGLTTNMTLLELSDLAHPLLQRLAFEAPGTYHHSLMVANLAQAAADEIGANSTLARVGAYFHDIGKVTKSGYFTENIRATENPHDDIAPSMSALLVMGHVKEGLGLAMLHKLPKPILDIIREHHGTGLVAYFHHKAGQQAQAEAADERALARQVDESHYRYPGPRPRSREAAILMMADSVEAASRSLEKPSPAHIGELVERLVDGRIEDGQLDECEMTLAELSRVKRAFLQCLTNMLHTRIAYPKT